MFMKRTKFFGVLMMALVCLMVTACGSTGSTGSSSGSKPDAKTEPAAAKSTQPIKVRMLQPSDGFGYVPLYVASIKGYFKEEGLEVDNQVASGGSKSLAAVMSGGADITVTSIGDVVEATSNGIGVKAFASVISKYPTNVVVKKSVLDKKGITQKSSYEDKAKVLKDLKVGITAASSGGTDWVARMIGKSVGLNPDKDMQIVPLGTSAAIIAAFKENKVDAFVSSSPTAETGVVQGDGMLLFSLANGEVPSLDNISYNAMVATDDYINKNPQVIEKLTKAMYKAGEYLKNNKEAAKKEVKQAYFDKLDDKVFNDSFENTYPAFAFTPVISKEGFQKNADAQGKGSTTNYEKAIYTKYFK